MPQAASSFHALLYHTSLRMYCVDSKVIAFVLNGGQQHSLIHACKMIGQRL